MDLQNVDTAASVEVLTVPPFATTALCHASASGW
jgi:hypothetical protein